METESLQVNQVTLTAKPKIPTIEVSVMDHHTKEADYFYYNTSLSRCYVDPTSSNYS